MDRNSGQIAAAPAIAASTCSHRLCFLQMAPISGSGSIAKAEVVPTVAQTKNGRRPSALSRSIACSNKSGRILNASSTSMARRFLLPTPATLMSFSIDECACADVYAVNACLQPSSFDLKFVARSRAVKMATSEALDAESCITPPPVDED